MKKLILILFLINFLCVFTQNLIPNGDFELGPDSSSGEWLYWVDNNCQYVGSVLGPDEWFVLNPSPDRMIENDILCNLWDNGLAYSGNAYIVLGTLNKESCGVSLLTPIEKDSVYNLKCYLSLESFGGIGTPPAKIAIRFNAFDSLTTPNFISNSWMLFDTIFKANENSNQMILEGIQNLNASSGVKIDNISLEKISTLSLNEFSININKIKIYPNPAKNYIQIESNEISEFILFDSIGQEIDRHSNVKGNLKYQHYKKEFIIFILR